jgi:hypothetical protein
MTDNEGTPLHGDRSAWNVDDYAGEHAKDIYDGTLLRHLPAPAADGNYVRDDGSNWQSQNGLPLPDLNDYARGSIIRGGAADWEAYDASLDGQILVGNGTDVASVSVSGDVTLANDGTIEVESLSLPDTDDSHDLDLVWNEDDSADRTLNLAVDGADRVLTLQGDLTVESASLLNQDLTTDASPTFGGLGIGRSPLYDLDIKADQNAATRIHVENQNVTSNASARVYLKADGHESFIGAFSDSYTTMPAFAGMTILQVRNSADFGISTIADSASIKFMVENSGNVVVGATSASAQLHAVQSDNSGNQPVLLLDQADVSEEAIKVSYDGADVDMILMNLDVTGGPQFGWDESEDAFYHTHDLVAWRESSTQTRVAGALAWEWTTATDATRAAVGKLYAEDYGASREVIAWGANGTAATLGFYGVTPVVRQAALTASLTTISYTAPGTADYAMQDFIDVSGDGSQGFAFADHDEANTLLEVVANLQTRVDELETKLQAYGLLN